MDIKEALLQGATPEKLKEDFEKQLAEAQSTIKAEQEKESKVDIARDAAVDALYEYYKAVGYIEDYTEEDLKWAKDALKNSEKHHFCFYSDNLSSKDLQTLLDKWKTLWN